MKHLITFLLAAILALPQAYAQKSVLHNQNGTPMMYVDGRPFPILGGELGNSSASCTEDIERIFPKLREMGLNTVLVPAYWDLTEPEEGVFDFSLTDAAIRQARQNGLKVIFLWFGAWKNSMSCYAPLWFKQDYDKYPRAHTKEGRPLEIASAFSENVYQADSRAFTQWMKHISETDKQEGTVIMVQIENEIGMLEDARDHSPEADALFYAPVPDELMKYLRTNKKQLHPELLQRWESRGCPRKGTWEEVFGAGLYTDEIFMAWHYAGYVERLAKEARAIYNVPLYVNAAMNSRNRKPGEYPSAGPLAHLVDIWRCAAPDIDFIAPDLYDNGFKDWVARYAMPGNPLFIPEIRLEDNDGVRAFYVFGEHDALGFSPFSIEDARGGRDHPLAKSYRTLDELAPLLARYRGRDVKRGLLFDMQDKESIFYQDDLKITCRHFFTLPWDPRATDGSTWPEGGGIIIRLAPDEYIVAGSGIVVEFEKAGASQGTSRALGEDGFAQAGGQADNGNATVWTGTRCGLGSVDEVRVNADGSLAFVRRLNGDQDHQGRHVRISVGDYRILHVRLYEYR